MSTNIRADIVREMKLPTGSASADDFTFDGSGVYNGAEPAQYDGIEYPVSTNGNLYNQFTIIKQGMPKAVPVTAYVQANPYGVLVVIRYQRNTDTDDDLYLVYDCNAQSIHNINDPETELLIVQPFAAPRGIDAILSYNDIYETNAEAMPRYSLYSDDDPDWETLEAETIDNQASLCKDTQCTYDAIKSDDPYNGEVYTHTNCINYYQDGSILSRQSAPFVWSSVGYFGIISPESQKDERFFYRESWDTWGTWASHVNDGYIEPVKYSEWNCRWLWIQAFNYPGDERFYQPNPFKLGDPCHPDGYSYAWSEINYDIDKWLDFDVIAHSAGGRSNYITSKIHFIYNVDAEMITCAMGDTGSEITVNHAEAYVALENSANAEIDRLTFTGQEGAAYASDTVIERYAKHVTTGGQGYDGRVVWNEEAYIAKNTSTGLESFDPEDIEDFIYYFDIVHQVTESDETYNVKSENVKRLSYAEITSMFGVSSTDFKSTFLGGELPLNSYGFSVYRTIIR